MSVLTLSQTSPCFYVSAVQVFENTVGKGEITRNKQFLLFARCVLPYLRTLRRRLVSDCNEQEV